MTGWDDLGRIVVPKEIRRTLRIREGDPLEIFTNRDGEIMLKKYSPIGELGEFAASYAESLASATGDLICITDRDYVIAAAGPKRKEYESKPLSRELETLIEKRGTLQAKADESAYIPVTLDDKGGFSVETITVILCNGDCIGAVVLYGKDEKKHSEDAEKLLAASAALFLGRQMEQ